MCGIVGFTGKLGNRQATLESMMDAIAHRGPDGAGLFLDDAVPLGHRRLAVIDPEGGAQPMHSADRKLSVVYNGEIYNYLDLRDALEKKGHRFLTRGDTEVLLHGYEEWGRGLPERLRGMFAFAVWDRDAKTLFCARDHFGIKPFYYYLRQGAFLFASEIKAFLPHPAFVKRLHLDQLELYLSYQYSPGENTFFDGVKKLPPAHWLEWRAGQVRTERYWTPVFEPASRPETAWKDAVAAVMRDSVEAHKQADAALGSSLSSGVDSAYIAALSGVDKTFTAGFDGGAYNEAGAAAAISEAIGAAHFLRSIGPEEYFESLGKIQYHMDEPLADASAPALYFVDRQAAGQVKVLLSGEGADEFFGGYHTYRQTAAGRIYDRLPRFLRRAAGAAASLLPPVHGVNFLTRHARPLAERYIGVTDLMSEKEKQRLLKTYCGRVKPQELSRPLFAAAGRGDEAASMQTVDIQLWMVGDILLKADKMSMANGLELRVPFIDKEVFEVARHTPEVCRVNGRRTKCILRAAASDLLPPQTAEREKLGFPVPVRAWLREERYMSLVRERLTDSTAAVFFDTAALDKLCLQHLSGKRDNWRQIWCVFMFLIWYDEFFIKR